ncbi:MAG: T9SS type A sorting domain-containing protein, partial [Melioribacteraceae bacterium]
VVLDVDEFDWATPGNGILIWHIDEKIINQNLAANKINVGKNRGVDLEEADGIQDIGEEFQTIFGDIVIAEGEEFDFWYSNNSSELYQNKFSNDTKPNTNLNSGANSLISFSNFSEIGNEMSFSVSFGSENINPLIRMEGFGEHESLKLSNNIDPFKSFSVQETGLTINFASLLIPNFTDVEFALVENNESELAIGSKDSLLKLFYFGNENTTQIVNIGAKCSAPIVVNQLNENESIIYVGLENGTIKTYRNNIVLNSAPILEETIQLFNSTLSQIAILDNELAASSLNKIKFVNGSEIIFPAEVKNFILTKNNSNEFVLVVLTFGNEIYTYKKEDQQTVKIYSGNYEIESIAVGDLKKSGENFIVFNEGNFIQVINFLGTQANNFPFHIDGFNFTGTPNIADLDNDGFADIISLNDNGDIYSVSGNTGKLISGFPISIGGNVGRLNTIVKRENDLLFSATSSDNEIFYWSFNSSGNVQWGSKFGNNLNSSSINSASDENFISTFFPQNRTYNWPNPVYGNETYIRTYVSEDSKVNIKIFDLAGDLVDESSFNAIGGLDTEIAWNVTNIQSGAYLAHLEATSNSGKSESKIIKIAIVK